MRRAMNEIPVSAANARPASSQNSLLTAYGFSGAGGISVVTSTSAKRYPAMIWLLLANITRRTACSRAARSTLPVATMLPRCASAHGVVGSGAPAK